MIKKDKKIHPLVAGFIVLPFAFLALLPLGMGYYGYDDPTGASGPTTPIGDGSYSGYGSYGAPTDPSAAFFADNPLSSGYGYGSYGGFYYPPLASANKTTTLSDSSRQTYTDDRLTTHVTSDGKTTLSFEYDAKEELEKVTETFQAGGDPTQPLQTIFDEKTRTATETYADGTLKTYWYELHADVSLQDYMLLMDYLKKQGGQTLLTAWPQMKGSYYTYIVGGVLQVIYANGNKENYNREGILTEKEIVRENKSLERRYYDERGRLYESQLFNRSGVRLILERILRFNPDTYDPTSDNAQVLKEILSSSPGNKGSGALFSSSPAASTPLS